MVGYSILLLPATTSAGVEKMKYTIPAIQTPYQGIVFNSGLEARWAAFFDDMYWSWAYESFTMRGWIPDFLLKGKEQNYLAEVKYFPAFSGWSEVLPKMRKGVADTHYESHPVFLLGGLIECTTVEGVHIATIGRAYSFKTEHHLPLYVVDYTLYLSNKPIMGRRTDTLKEAVRAVGENYKQVQVAFNTAGQLTRWLRGKENQCSGQ